MSKLFERLSTEEVSVAQEVDTTLSIEEAMDMMECQAEFDAIAKETEEDVAAMEEAETIVARTQEAVASQEALLAIPESVTAAHALVSQESLRHTAELLGADAEAVISEELSLEAAEKNPVTALELSVEGAKEFIKNVIEKIKAIFKKIGVGLKKLYVKAVDLLNNTEKAAKKLQESLKDYSENAQAALTDKQVEVIVGKLAFAGLDSKVIGVKEVLAYHAAINDTGYIMGLNKDLLDYDNEKIKLLQSSPEDAEAAKKLSEKTLSSLGGYIKKTTVFQKATDKVRGVFGFDKKYDEKLTQFAMLEATGTTAKFLVETIAKDGSLQTRKESVSLQKSMLKDIKVPALKLAEVKSIIDAVVKSNSKTFIKNANDIFAAREKHIADMEKAAGDAEWTSAAKGMFTAMLSNSQTQATSLSLDVILGNIKGNNNVLAASKVFLEAHKK